jgi:acetyl esterase/lipase
LVDKIIKKWYKRKEAIIMIFKSIKNYFVGKMLNKWEEKDKKILSKQSLPENIVEIINVPYKEDGQKGHLLDIYYPNNIEGTFPCIIDIHGGGFLYGDKELNKLSNYHLAKKGFIVFNINYRLALNDIKISEQIQDTIEALNWIGNNFNKYPVNKEKIYMLGESAGGYLAVMAAVVSRSRRLQNIFNVNEPEIRINALAVNCGFMELERKGIKYWGMRTMILEKRYNKKEYYNNLILDKISEIKNLPPVFATSNENDELNFMTLYFLKILERNKLEYKYCYIENGVNNKLGHTFNILYPELEESKKLNNEMLEYLIKY